MPALLKAACQEQHTFNNVLLKEASVNKKRISFWILILLIPRVQAAHLFLSPPPPPFSRFHSCRVRMCLTWEGACPKLMPRPTSGCLQKAHMPFCRLRVLVFLQDLKWCLFQVRQSLSIQFQGWIMHNSIAASGGYLCKEQNINNLVDSRVTLDDTHLKQFEIQSQCLKRYYSAGSHLTTIGGSPQDLPCPRGVFWEWE